MEETQKLTPKKFLFNVLNGVALAIVVGLIPNAILGGLFSYLSQYHDFFSTLLYVVQGIQFTIPIITGVLIALQFGFNPMQTVVTGTAAFVGSGAAEFSENKWVLVGIGDLINTMITAAIAVGIILIIKDRLGSLNIILLPIIAGGIAGLIGLLLLPYTKWITLGIGEIVNSVTNTQPIIMSIIIAVLFSIIIISPVSTVAIGIAIGISGLAAGSAAIGVAASAIMLAIGTWKVNKVGVPIAILLGAMKMMMPNMIRYPMLLLPVVCTAAVSGFVSSLFNIQGVPESAGFGLVGLIGPIKTIALLDTSMLSSILIVLVCYVIVPFVSALFFHYLFMKVLKLYDATIFTFDTEA
ncbi:PTS transporter subunit IIC [Staphylococcus coagulans]|uniref:PTS transporter subunit IIC n=1 Tax=Staphylococcus coagulans TaxID=74706 RepID=A0A9X1E5Q7_9STAP|nr:PTS sugar transporter subunit IIC [Staphylococcus coagulans]MBA8772470.1 PTS transporter subunit IIC [Staphylococcus coagulans]MBA8777403.1 PTS transporter subunit IIC [Staphylococcus coagulans]MBT2830133.1 PTS transporter subunit IIC [Staphylococcus coagulans]MBT2860134.1 PTS transporter subunit IIC [Staphylococcus coagulans]MBU3873240.1 PTS transporter subunit IIC [Staphylococcus coagulans]